MYGANVLTERIGIDKTVITNFKINTIDTVHLKSMDIDLIIDKNSLLISNNNIGIRTLKIADNYFGKLECGMTNANPKRKIIDIEDIFPLLKEYSKGNYSRRKKMVLRKAKESERDLIGVTEKINEILDKLKSFNE